MTAAAFCVFMVLNVPIAIWRIVTSIQDLRWQERPRVDVDWYSPSYVGNNYPMHLPTPPLETVAMGLHETVHYGLNASEDIGDDEWNTILYLAEGSGRVRIGPSRRAYVVSYLHQLHCLRGFQRGIVSPGRKDGVSPASGHMHHCLNYLRQTFLCAALDMLEKGDFMQSNFTEGTVGSDLVCQDWKAAVADLMQRNYNKFVEWNEKWN
ncbi:hypothetical protein NM688_g5768 [Phlebia brevispora]|uniref:Uncharacterized protein n=1 Tax=Phlebia brevispora TaxID=194682 RepID=A0ACC1SQ41_9APHY|nr:hypothetical protein NM688_g5768 [Phlebia brevispora]